MEAVAYMKRAARNPDLVPLFQASGRKLTFAKGEIILRAGDEPQGVYLIEKGLVKIYALSNNGEERIHLFYAEHDVFPLMWAFKHAVRNVYYEALEPTTLWIMPLDTFRGYISQNPEAANHLLEQTVGLFRLYASRIDNLLRSNSNDRVAQVLISLTSRFGVKTGPGEYTIDAVLTHSDIGSSINLTRETSSRAIERLKRNGVIAYDDERRIVVKNMEKLIKIVGEEEVASIWPDLVRNATARHELQ